MSVITSLENVKPNKYCTTGIIESHFTPYTTISYFGTRQHHGRSYTSTQQLENQVAAAKGEQTRFVVELMLVEFTPGCPDHSLMISFTFLVL